MGNEQGKNLIIDRNQFQKLFDTLHELGYQTLGPTVRENVVIFDTIDRVEDLPIGKTDEQSPGSYRLKNRTDKALFSHGVGPQSPKKFLFPMRTKLFEAQKDGRSFSVSPGHDPAANDIPKLAFVGIKPCELSAIKIQDKVFIEGIYADPSYRSLRERSLMIVVNCTTPGKDCFCASMNTGPMAVNGFDLSLTEIVSGDEHYFVAEAGSDKGTELLQKIPTRPVEPAQAAKARQVCDQAGHSVGKRYDTKDVATLLFDNLEHPEWDAVAARCLMCANCTMVCPTCFCTTTTVETDLSGERTEHWRRWNSCFTLDFTKVAGGNFRMSAKSRYRQWLTHKLGGWHEQFGSSGCVGCGRCITWCPVGIDIIAEVEAIRGNTISR
jgi:formate hydrogenlyase subunit 6/NADH:ubiquinone oxidoreductase subunit I